MDPKRVRRIVLWLVGALVAIQLIPVWLWQKNPAVAQEPAWDTPATRQLARDACFDCHSNQTAWPVYSKIAPTSWLVTYDVLNGRAALNFTEWGVARREAGGERGEQKSGEEVAKQIREGEMPPGIYVMMHQRARLTDQQRMALIRGLQASLGAGPASAEREEHEAEEGRERR